MSEEQGKVFSKIKVSPLNATIAICILAWLSSIIYFFTDRVDYVSKIIEFDIKLVSATNNLFYFKTTEEREIQLRVNIRGDFKPKLNENYFILYNNQKLLLCRGNVPKLHAASNKSWDKLRGELNVDLKEYFRSYAPDCGLVGDIYNYYT